MLNNRSIRKKDGRSSWRGQPTNPTSPATATYSYHLRQLGWPMGIKLKNLQINKTRRSDFPSLRNTTLISFGFDSDDEEGWRLIAETKSKMRMNTMRRKRRRKKIEGRCSRSRRDREPDSRLGRDSNGNQG
ncbi:hypothetical protein YC2023_023585 [Brassica napus]